MTIGNAKKPQENPHAFDAPVFDHILGPPRSMRAYTIGVYQKVCGAPFYAGDFLRRNVATQGAEPARLGFYVDGDHLLQALIKDAHDPAVPSRPHLPGLPRKKSLEAAPAIRHDAENRQEGNDS